MKTLPSWMLVLAEALLLIASTTVVFIPAARSPPMHVVVVALVLSLFAQSLWSLQTKGVLHMTLAQIYASSDPRKPRATLLGAVAGTMGAVALVVLSL